MLKELEFVKDLDKIIVLAQGPSWYQCPDEKEYTHESEDYRQQQYWHNQPDTVI